jgi:peptidoglycan/xylan/chitin deacetylase (PgdA/CDA1 family)
VDDRRHQWTDRLEYAIDQAPSETVRAAARTMEAAMDEVSERALRGEYLGQVKARLKNLAQEERAEAVDAIETTLGVSLAAAVDVPELYEPLFWDEIREMAASGLVTFGSHTVSHYILSRCTTETIHEEVACAKQIIEQRLGAPCPLFCYPNGAVGDFDARTRKTVMQAGHSCALTTVEGFVNERSDIFELGRLGVMNGQSFEHFVVNLAGVTRWAAQLKGLIG